MEVHQTDRLKFWMSGEVQREVGDHYREARKSIEAALNQCVEGKDYGEGLKLWSYIAIILKPGFDEYYPEVKRYRKKKKEVEFRLKIDYEKFLRGNAETHLRFVAESVLRTLDLMREMKIRDLDLQRLSSDINQCLSSYLR